MSKYKAEITLNEKDSLTDTLILEKTLTKTYALVLTEGTTKGFREKIKKNFMASADDQLHTFLLLCETGYYKVNTAPYEEVEALREETREKLKELN